VAAYGLQLGARYALFGLGGHALFTGLFGASLGFALQTRRRWLRILAPIAGTCPRHCGPHAKQRAAAVCNTYEDRRRQATTGERTDP
jgi:hypothetical protein